MLPPGSILQNPGKTAVLPVSPPTAPLISNLHQGCFSFAGIERSKQIMKAIFLLSLVAVVHGNWQEWWTYDGISGPGYWGVINPAWTLCNRGRHQVDSVVEFQN